MQTMKLIDVTPTWRDLMPLLIEVAANGATTKGRREAMAELMRLADLVDEMNAAKREAHHE